MSTLPIAFDDGTSAQVPMEKVAAALKDGGKVVQAMRFDDNSTAYVSLDKVHDALRDGGMVIGQMPGRPSVQMQPVADLNPLHFANRAAGRVEQNLNAVADMPAEFQREIDSAANSPHSFHALVNNVANATYGTLTKLWNDYKSDPANALGDVATAALGGAATESADVAPGAAAAKAPVELPLAGKLVRTYDFLKSIGGDAHAPELSTVTDGLNDLSQAVIQRINAAKAAGLSDTAPAAAPAGQSAAAAVADRTASATAPFRMGPGEVPPDYLSQPNPRVLAGNQGVITTPKGLLPAQPDNARYLSILQGTPKAVRNFADVRDDLGFQQAMQTDLEHQGAAAYAEQAQEFAARNSMDLPKWQRVLNQKIDELIQQTEQKQTTSPAVKPYKAKAAAAGADDDLTSILQASLDIARKKRGPK